MQAYCVKCCAKREMKVEGWEALLFEWHHMEDALDGLRSLVPPTDDNAPEGGKQ